MSDQDNELFNMMNQFNDNDENVISPLAGSEDNGDQGPDAPPAEESGSTAEQNTDGAVVMDDTNSVPVSTVILENQDKYHNMVLCNPVIAPLAQDIDLVNYITYIDTSKKIPCVYDCCKLRLPNSSVKNADGTWKVTSIEGRRSGVIIKCGSTRDLVMTKNFIYDCEFDANGVLIHVNKYNRRKIIETVPMPTVETVYENAVLLVGRILPKVTKCGKYTTLDLLKEQVKLAYSKVDDVNGIFRIIPLRMVLGC